MDSLPVGLPNDGIQPFGMRLGRTSEANQRRRLGQGTSTAFHDFFLEGNEGFELFPRIRSFLSAPDLVACAKTGHTMQRNNLCRTYTLNDILSDRGQDPSKEERMAIGLSVTKAITQFKGGRHRPRKVVINIEDDTAFWSNLYHPDEVAQVEHIIDSHLPSASKTLKSTLPRYSVADGSFSHFFHVGCVGDTVFPMILPYLSVWDLASFALSGMQTEEGQHVSDKLLFTVGDVLATRGANVSRMNRILIGKEAAKTVVRYKGGSSHTLTRPHRKVEGFGDRWRWENLYHPAELSEVEELVDFCLQVLRNATLLSDMPMATRMARDHQSAPRVLGSASFVALRLDQSMDVTLQVALLARANGHTLRLNPPPSLTHNKGKRVFEPTTFRWWFLRYFGDPFPNETKHLTIRYCQAGLTGYREKIFHENRSTTLKFVDPMHFEAIVGMDDEHASSDEEGIPLDPFDFDSGDDGDSTIQDDEDADMFLRFGGLFLDDV